MHFSGTLNEREGVENMGSAMLPSLRIGNTFTSKTINFGRKETADGWIIAAVLGGDLRFFEMCGHKAMEAQALEASAAARSA